MQVQKETLKFFNNQHEKIEKKSFKKVAFLGIAIALGIYLGLGTINFSRAYFENKNALERQEILSVQNQKEEIQKLDQKQKILLVNKIIEIDDSQFNGLINYVEAEQSFYDSRIALISKALTAAQSENTGTKKDVINANNTNRDLNKLILNYKKEFEQQINSLQNVYIAVKSGQGENINSKQLNSFINTYNKYLIGLPERSTFIENQINDILFSSTTGNIKYNEKNNILEQNKTLEAEAIQIIKKTRVRP